MTWTFTALSSILWPVFPQTPQMQTDHTICSKRRHILFFSTKTFWKSDKLPLAKCFLVKNSVSGFWIRYNFSMVCWKRCDVCLRTIWELDWNTARDADEGFGMKFPHGTNGAKARPVPAAPISFKKSRRERPLFCAPS